MPPEPARPGCRGVTLADLPLLARLYWRWWRGDPATELGSIRRMVEGRATIIIDPDRRMAARWAPLRRPGSARSPTCSAGPAICC